LLRASRKLTNCIFGRGLMGETPGNRPRRKGGGELNLGLMLGSKARKKERSQKSLLRHRKNQDGLNDADCTEKNEHAKSRGRRDQTAANFNFKKYSKGEKRGKGSEKTGIQHLYTSKKRLREVTGLIKKN